MVLAVVALVAATACNGDDDPDQALPSSTSSPAATEAAEPVDPFCAPADALGETFDDIAPADGDPAALREQLTQAREAIAQTEAEAPEEIRPDVAVLADGYDDFLAALEAVDFDFEQLPLSAVVALDSPELQVAGERLDAYQADVCGEGG